MKTEIKICMGSACFARGNDANLEYIEQFVKEHNLDVDVILTGGRCENACPDGPNLMVNDTRYTHVTLEKTKEILEALLNE